MSKTVNVTVTRPSGYPRDGQRHPPGATLDIPANAVKGFEEGGFGRRTTKADEKRAEAPVRAARRAAKKSSARVNTRPADTPPPVDTEAK